MVTGERIYFSKEEREVLSKIFKIIENQKITDDFSIGETLSYKNIKHKIG